MTLPTQVRCFIEEHLPPMALVPKLTGAVVAVAGGFVERFLGLAQRGVGSGNELPVE